MGNLLFSFNGRIERGPFIGATLANVFGTLILAFAIVFIAAANDPTPAGSGMPTPLIVTLLVLFGLSCWIAMALIVKRNRDAYESSFWVWLSLISFFFFAPGWFAALIKLSI